MATITIPYLAFFERLFRYGQKKTDLKQQLQKCLFRQCNVPNIERIANVIGSNS
jgi:5'-3' exonuclease